MTTFQGFTVLEIEPNGETQAPEIYQRALVNLDAGIGKIWVDDRGASPVMRHVFDWWMESGTDIATMKAFIAAQAGRLVPFWAPTWNQDLSLSGAGSVNSGDTSLTIVWCGYTQFQFANKARRYLALIPYQAGGSNAYVKVTASQDNGNGTETLTLSGAVGANFAAGSFIVSFLTLCRLASDDIKVAWETPQIAHAMLEFQEIPQEAP